MLRYAFLILAMLSFLVSNPIDISTKDEISLLSKSHIYIANSNEDIKSVVKKLKPLNKEHINAGITNKVVWIKFTLKNSTNKPVTKALVLSSPLLESITLYSSDLKKIEQKGMFYTPKEHSTIPYYFLITIPPKSQKSFYLKVGSIFTALDFSLHLKDPKLFLMQDRNKQAINLILIGFVLALMVYTILISIYLKDKSYFFYGLYLFALLYQQVTYLGITQIYMPSSFLPIEAKITIPKIIFLIVTSALFAMSFLDIRKFPKIDFLYKAIILISILEAIFLNPKNPISLYIVIFTGAIFITFNLIAGFIVYFSGKKEARLFIVGFSIVFISYILIIIDALGLASVMIHFPNILIWATAFEALILSLAFADRYIILQKEKELIDKKLIKEHQEREKIIKTQVTHKTLALNRAVKEKELLLKEVHHRVKNNLQIILSMIRLQSDSSKGCAKDILEKLESRINAIAKTYTNLLAKDNFKTVDMKSYIDDLIKDIVDILGNPKGVTIKTNASLELPFKKSVYIGLIINELVTNSFKHAFKDKKGVIKIDLYKKDGKNILEVFDNGKGFNSDIQKSSLGLKLIYIIVKNQLNGTITIDSNNKTHCIIRF